MKTLIIDNYDSFTFNLYQLVGELGGNPTVVRNDQITVAHIKKGDYTHIIISPGPGSADDPAYFGICKEVIRTFAVRVPILGVCLGHQGIISAYGGRVVRAENIKHGKTSIIKHCGRDIFMGVRNPLIGMRYHSLVGEKESLPGCLEIIAISADDQVVMGVKHLTCPTYGVQFHPESIGTPDGRIILKNFLWN